MSELVSPDDPHVMTVFPSICATAAGRAMGWLYESIPLRIGAIKLSHLLFTLPTVPLVLPLYAWMKAFGPRYVLSSRRLGVTRTVVGNAVASVPLDEVGRVEVVSTIGHRFYHAGDLLVRDHLGAERLRLRGVVRPEGFRATILEVRDALVRTEAARRTIAARHAGERIAPVPPAAPIAVAAAGR